MTDRVVARGPDALVLERRLDPARDRFLRQHALHGKPIVPAAFACEMMAEAAALACPGFEVEELRQVRMESPLHVPPDGDRLVRVVARVVEQTPDGRTVEVETRSPFASRGREVERVHHRGRVLLSRGRRTRGAAAPIPEAPGPVHARSYFHLGRGPMGRGPLFSLASWIQVSDAGATGTATRPDPRDVFGFTSWPRFEVDPVLLDTALQVAGSWDGFRGGHCPVPLGFERVAPGRPLAPRERGRVQASVRRVEHPDVLYDVLVAGEDGGVVLELEGVRLHRTDPAGWAPA